MDPELVCQRNLIILVAVAAIIGVIFVSQSPPSITQLTHVSTHNPGECHIFQECKLGQICFHDCSQFNANGICVNQTEIGKCTDFCNSDKDCINSTCQTKAWWQFNTGSIVNICV